MVVPVQEVYCVRMLLLFGMPCFVYLRSPDLESKFGRSRAWKLEWSYAGSRLAACGHDAQEIAQPMSGRIRRPAKLKGVWRRAFPGRREKSGGRSIRNKSERERARERAPRDQRPCSVAHCSAQPAGHPRGSTPALDQESLARIRMQSRNQVGLISLAHE
jgi:hypothetical protein